MSTRTQPPTAAQDSDPHLAELLRVLTDVRGGHYSSRVDERPDGELGLIHQGVNTILNRLAELQKRVGRLADELEDALSKVEFQRAFMRELSSPIIEVGDRILCLPVIGMLDAERSAEMTVQLLSAIAEKRATHAVIDVTAVGSMDESTVKHFVRMASAIRLLGTECFITGIGPELAGKLVKLGINVGPIATRRTLREALAAILATRQSRRQAASPASNEPLR